jgi:hypothetical protein
MNKAPAPKKKDLLAPPAWWKKWRPLRWLAGAGVLSLLVLAAQNLLEKEQPLPVVEVAAVEPVAVEAAPAPSVETNPAPPPATPAPAAVAKPTQPAVSPAMGGEVIEDLPPPEQVYDYKAFTAVESSRVGMMGAFKSYSSVDDVFSRLQKEGYEPEISSNYRKVPPELPPYHIDLLMVSGYRNLGQTGSLTLQFFNDRLFEAEFQPDNAEAYLQQLRRELPGLRPGRTGRAELQSGVLRIASSLDLAVSEVGRNLRTRPFVLWQDLRLVRQRDRWDARYAEDLVR